MAEYKSTSPEWYETPGGQFAIGSAGTQILSGFLQAEMVSRQAKTQAEIAEFNASLAQYDSWKVQAYGQTLVAASQNQIDQARGTTKVYAGSKGIEVEGSLAEVSAENELNSLMMKMNIDNRTTEQAMGYTRQARQIRLGSSLNTLQSNTQASSLRLGGIAHASGNLGAAIVGGQKITKEDLNLPQLKNNAVSGYSTSDYTLTKDVTAPRLLGLSLMPGGY